jgi:hypothetical protein
MIFPMTNTFLNNDYPRFTGFPDATTYLAIQNKMNPQKFWSRSGIIAFCILIPFAVIFLTSLNKNVPILTNILSLLITGGIIFTAYWIGIRLRNNDQRKRYLLATEKEHRTGWVDTSGIHIQFSGGRTDLEWSHFTGIVELNDTIGLIKDKTLIDALSATMFSSAEEWQRARQVIRDRLAIQAGSQIAHHPHPQVIRQVAT